MISQAKSIEEAIRQGCAIVGFIKVNGGDSGKCEFAIGMQKDWEGNECLGLFAMCDGLELDTEVTFNPAFYANHIQDGQVVCGPMDRLVHLVETAFQGVGFRAIGHINGSAIRIWRDPKASVECALESEFGGK